MSAITKRRRPTLESFVRKNHPRFHEQAAAIAPLMTAARKARGVKDEIWEMENWETGNVLYVALSIGLDELEKRYPTPGEAGK